MAKAKGCDGIICGHIHKAENRMIDGIHYLNSGDWVETMSALAEDHEGNWELIYFNQIDFKKMETPPGISIPARMEVLPELALPRVAFTGIQENEFQTPGIQR
jgi:hypothetical protein